MKSQTTSNITFYIKIFSDIMVHNICQMCKLCIKVFHLWTVTIHFVREQTLRISATLDATPRPNISDKQQQF